MGVVDTLIGLQWGSEGKGKIAKYLASQYKVMVRSGGPQAGHTFYHKKNKYINRQVPCGVFNNCILYIAPTGIINTKVLEEEIGRYFLDHNKLKVDKNSMVINTRHIETEIRLSLNDKLASTCQGVGSAQSDKILRKGVLFKDVAKSTELSEYSADVVECIQEHISKREKILIEGTQGFGLCLNHGEYPFVTSRDVTSSALLNDCGISPKDHNITIGVLRTYPIRVGGNSGPTKSLEITWEEIENRSGSNSKIREYATVTNRLRRIFEQDFETLRRAIMVNKPDWLALTFLDYINKEDYGKQSFDELSNKSKQYILELENKLGIPIKLIGTGPSEEHMISR